MTNTNNAYCTVLGISVPRIESARTSPDANYYGLLLVALLERGGPLTRRGSFAVRRSGCSARVRGACFTEAVQTGTASDLPRRYPHITFASTAIVVKTHSPSDLDISVTGQLTIRDVTQQVIVPVHDDLGDNALTATGRFTVKQTAFGTKYRIP